MSISDLILGRENAWAKLYDATRPTPFVTQESIKQNIDVGMHWVGDRFKGISEAVEKIGTDELLISYTTINHRSFRQLF